MVAVGQVGNLIGNLRSEPESFQHPRSDGRWSASAQQGAPDELVGERSSTLEFLPIQASRNQLWGGLVTWLVTCGRL